MKTYAMAAEGSAFCRDGIDLSWPRGGAREVIELDPKAAPESFRLRVHHGVIEEVEGLEATKVMDAPTPYRLYEGEEARAVRAEPAAPVVVTQHSRRAQTSTRVTLSDSRDTLPPPEEIGTIISEPAAATTPALARSAHRRG